MTMQATLTRFETADATTGIVARLRAVVEAEGVPYGKESVFMRPSPGVTDGHPRPIHRIQIFQP